MIQNTTKRKLAAGETVVGAFYKYRDADFAEYVAHAVDWDFLVMDGEHGTVQSADFANLSRAIELRGTTPIARVNTAESSAILRALDGGAHGVHVPWINSAAEAEQVVQWVKYGPRGIRGLAGNRSLDWAATEETVAQANEETMVIIHVETQTAVDQIEELVAVDGVDVLFIGPTDLSHSLGTPGRKDTPEMVAAMDRVAEVVVPSDVALGILAATPDWSEAWKAKGARYLATGIDGLLKGAMAEYIAKSR